MADEETESQNWEEQADSGVLDKRLEDLAIDLQVKEEKKKQTTNTHSSPDGMILPEESGRSQYQPQVRILRRENKDPSHLPQNHSNSIGATSAKSSKHSKSLQQREAEYAQARLRIFGSLPPEDDDEEGGENCDESPTAGDSIRNQCSPQIIKAEPSGAQVSVLRQPKGPDGTNGFTKSHPT